MGNFSHASLLPFTPSLSAILVTVDTFIGCANTQIHRNRMPKDEEEGKKSPLIWTAERSFGSFTLGNGSSWHAESFHMWRDWWSGQNSGGRLGETERDEVND